MPRLWIGANGIEEFIGHCEPVFTCSVLWPNRMRRLRENLEVLMKIDNHSTPYKIRDL